MTTQEILIQAKEAKTALMLADAERKNKALHKMADALVKQEHAARILEANTRDLEAAKGTIPDVMLDRLMLNEKRIADMADGIREVAKLEDPVGKVLSEIVRQQFRWGSLRLYMKAARMLRVTQLHWRLKAAMSVCCVAAKKPGVRAMPLWKLCRLDWKRLSCHVQQ